MSTLEKERQQLWRRIDDPKDRAYNDAQEYIEHGKRIYIVNKIGHLKQTLDMAKYLAFVLVNKEVQPHIYCVYKTKLNYINRNWKTALKSTVNDFFYKALFVSL